MRPPLTDVNVLFFGRTLRGWSETPERGRKALWTDPQAVPMGVTKAKGIDGSRCGNVL